jgi:uncharacterized membrane protein YedE/YeeE
MRIDTVSRVGTFLLGLVVIIGGFNFLDRLLINLQDPDLAAVDASQVGMVIGGVLTIMTVVVNSIFQSEVQRSTSRQAQASAQTGAQAALSIPGESPAVSMPVTPAPVEATVPVASESGPEPPSISTNG